MTTPDPSDQTEIPLGAWSVDSTSDLLVRLARKTTVTGLMHRILKEARMLTGAEGGTFYQLDESTDSPQLIFKAIHNTVLGLESRDPEQLSQWLAIPLYYRQPDDSGAGEPNHQNVASWVALTQQPVNIDDVYQAGDFDFSGTRHFDAEHRYRSRSMLTLPLLNHEDRVIGVLQLINARTPDGDSRPFTDDDQRTVQAMAKFAALSLDNQLLVQSHKDLLDAFIQALARIIDVRSSHTSAHCERIPVLTEMMARAACEETDGYFADFNLNDDEWYELHVAAWLHDCGKLATPETILNKGRKLQSLLDGFDAVAGRFAAAMAQADSPNEADELREELDFLERINLGGEFMPESDKDRVRAIAARSWQDAWGQQQPLLNEAEVTNLCITRGTLNDEERQAINRHIDITIDILEQLPFPPKLRRVPEYAGGHHERMDGRGFPRGLTRDQMSIPARIMGVADVFEALTAKERPYKPPMPLSQAFSILKSMRDDQHIDPDVFELFLRSGKWRDYAERFLLPDQIDVGDVAPYLADSNINTTRPVSKP
ncbi:GAF and HD-GYP domain-containing protein [Saccharospirillum sp.]|uniref:GAF and HD-GYP domain-containing protein n=1 Tax=Saccharospirillum sp. TaxID=2033801 RepID=UPI00349FFAFC